MRGKIPKRLPVVSNLSLTDDIDLVAIILATAVILVFIIAPFLRDSIFRSALGVLFILFIPGYSVVAALFPKHEDLSTFERLALSFGLSVAIVLLIALVLSYTPVHITLGSLVIAITLVSVFCVLSAKIRRDALSADVRFAVRADRIRQLRGVILPDSSARVDRIVSIVLIVSVLTTAAAFAYVVAMPKQGENFTSFYILGPERRIDDYPTTYQLGQQKPIVVGVTNSEHRNAAYDLVVTLNDGVNQSTLHAVKLTLDDGQTWEKTIQVKPDRAGTNMKMAFLLYLDNDAQKPYRENHLWVNVTLPA